MNRAYCHSCSQQNVNPKISRKNLLEALLFPYLMWWYKTHLTGLDLYHRNPNWVKFTLLKMGNIEASEINHFKNRYTQQYVNPEIFTKIPASFILHLLDMVK